MVKSAGGGYSALWTAAALFRSANALHISPHLRIIFLVLVVCVLVTCCAKQCGSKPHSGQSANEIDARHVRRFFFWWTASRQEKTTASGSGNAGDRRRGRANLESALTAKTNETVLISPHTIVGARSMFFGAAQERLLYQCSSGIISFTLCATFPKIKRCNMALGRCVRRSNP